MQSQSSDPTDAGAHNLTMYGIDQIHLLKNHVVDTVGNTSNYFIPNTTEMALQTEHTSVSTSLLSAPAEAITHMFTQPVADAAGLHPANVIGGILVVAVFTLVLSKLFIVKR